MQISTLNLYIAFSIIFWIVAFNVYSNTITSFYSTWLHYYKNYNTKNFLWNFYKLKKETGIKEICFIKNDSSDVTNYIKNDKILLYIGNAITKKYCNFITWWSNPLVDGSWNNLLSWNNYKTFYIKYLKTNNSTFKLDNDYYELF